MFKHMIGSKILKKMSFWHHGRLDVGMQLHINDKPNHQEKRYALKRFLYAWRFILVRARRRC
jgi:hypothetical protein